MPMRARRWLNYNSMAQVRRQRVTRTTLMICETRITLVIDRYRVRVRASAYTHAQGGTRTQRRR